LATGFLPRIEPPRPAILAAAALAALAGLTALSMAWASDQGTAFEDAIRVLAYGGVFLLVVVTTRSEDAPAWLRGLAIGTTVVAALAIVARLEPSLFGHPEAELAAQVPADANRLSWPIGYWNGLGALCALSVGLLAWLGGNAATRAGRTLAVAAMPLTILCLYATTSRGGMIAAAIALIVLIAAGPRRLRFAASSAVGLAAGGALIWVASSKSALFDHPGTDNAATQGDQVLVMLVAALAIAAVARYLLDPAITRVSGPRLERRTWLGIAIGAAVILIVAIVISDPAERWEEFKSPPTIGDTAGERHVFARSGSSGRWQFWSTAYDAFETEPFRGIGAGGYPAWWNQHGTLASDTRNAHSLAMDSLAELGVLGFVVVIVFFGAVAVVGIRRVRSVADPTGAAAAALAVFAAGCVGVAADWNWDLPAVFTPAIVAAALLTGPATLGADPPRAPVRGVARSRRRFAAGVAVLGFAWVAICASGLLLAARYELTASRHAADDRDFTKAAQQANNAIDLEPWAAEPRRQLAEVLFEAGNLPEAGKAIDEAIARDREDPALWLVRAQVQLASGDRHGAVTSVAFAKNLAPRAPELQPRIADLLKAIS
jgi:O-antigen ligase